MLSNITPQFFFRVSFNQKSQTKGWMIFFYCWTKPVYIFRTLINNYLIDNSLHTYNCWIRIKLNVSYATTAKCKGRTNVSKLIRQNHLVSVNVFLNYGVLKNRTTIFSLEINKCMHIVKVGNKWKWKYKGMFGIH